MSVMQIAKVLPIFDTIMLDLCLGSGNESIPVRWQRIISMLRRLFRNPVVFSQPPTEQRYKRPQRVLQLPYILNKYKVEA